MMIMEWGKKMAATTTKGVNWAVWKYNIYIWWKIWSGKRKKPHKKSSKGVFANNVDKSFIKTLMSSFLLVNNRFSTISRKLRNSVKNAKRIRRRNSYKWRWKVKNMMEILPSIYQNNHQNQSLWVLKITMMRRKALNSWRSQ